VCGTVDNFGLSKDAIQIWLDVQQLINLGLTATYVRDDIEVQNRNIATGKLGQAPAPEGRARSSTG
jgi:HAE1 family hydrophobic/amphiphilic exporter-1